MEANGNAGATRSRAPQQRNSSRRRARPSIAESQERRRCVDARASAPVLCARPSRMNPCRAHPRRKPLPQRLPPPSTSSRRWPSSRRVVARLEQGDVPLEEALQAFERGVTLTRACQEALTAAEQKVEILLERPDGSHAAAPFDAVGDRGRPGVTGADPAARLAAWQARVEAGLDAAPARRHRAAGAAARGDALQRARRRQAHPAGARLCDRRAVGRRRRAAGRRGCGRRDDPRLFADPRRPAGDGRRRPAPRPADLPPRSSTRPPRFSPATRCRCWPSSASPMRRPAPPSASR